MSNDDEDISLSYEGIAKANENSDRRAQDVVDGPQKEQTTQDYLDARREDLRDRIGKSLSLDDSDDGRVSKAVDDLEPPSFDLEAAEKSEAEKTGEKIGDAVAKRIEDALSEAETSDPSDARETGDDVNVAETVEKNADKVDAITSTLIRYLEDGGSLRDSVDDLETWDEDLPGA